MFAVSYRMSVSVYAKKTAQNWGTKTTITTTKLTARSYHAVVLKYLTTSFIWTVCYKIMKLPSCNSNKWRLYSLVYKQNICICFGDCQKNSQILFFTLFIRKETPNILYKNNVVKLLRFCKIIKHSVFVCVFFFLFSVQLSF